MNVSVRHLGRWIGFAAAAVLSATTAHATYGPGAKLEILQVPQLVTRSTAALPTFASYKFRLTSLDHDRLKKISFKGTVATHGSTEAATLLGAEGASCALAAGALECEVPGELSGYGKSLSFTVTLKTPTAGTAIVVSGKALFFEWCCHWKATANASATTALTDPDPNALETFVPASPTATTLFSGSNTQSGVIGAIPIVDAKAVPPINDPFTTTVIVPAGSASTTASVAERELAQSCSANPRCFESQLVIPGSFDFLKIILRRDRTTLMSSTKPKGHGHHEGKDRGKGHDRDDDDDRYSGQSSIDNAIVKYFPDDDPAQPDKFIIVPNCSVVPGGLPTPKNPCIASRKAYPVPKKGKPSTVPAGLEGDWEFIIHALDNGRYVN